MIKRNGAFFYSEISTEINSSSHSSRCDTFSRKVHQGGAWLNKGHRLIKYLSLWKTKPYFAIDDVSEFLTCDVECGWMAEFMKASLKSTDLSLVTIISPLFSLLALATTTHRFPPGMLVAHYGCAVATRANPEQFPSWVWWQNTGFLKQQTKKSI